MFLLKCHHSLLSLVVSHSHLNRDTLSGQHGCSVWGPSRALPTHRESASSFSFCVCEREWASFFVSDLYSLLPASIKSDPTMRRAAMHSYTLVLYLSSYMLSSLDCVCVVRPEWNDDMTTSCRCRHVVILCLYSQLALNDLWLKWWYTRLVLWLIASVFYT